jgi:hypothetical protein
VTETKDTGKEKDPNEDRATVWMDVGHVAGDLPEGVVPQSGQVLVYADNGEVVADQPDLSAMKKEYEETNAAGVPAPTTDPELVPPTGTAKAAPTGTGTGSTASKSGS